MILVDWQIREKIQNGELGIDPIEDGQIGPASIDLRLDDTKMAFIPNEGQNTWLQKSFTFPEHINIPGERKLIKSEDIFDLQPKEFALFSTVEKVTLGNGLVGQLEGRSSIGRQGLFIHNAGFIDPGFSGTITLELFNASDSPLLIPVGMKICQLVIFECAVPDVPYNRRKSSKYLNQMGVTPSKLYLEAELYDSNRV